MGTEGCTGRGFKVAGPLRVTRGGWPQTWALPLLSGLVLQCWVAQGPAVPGSAPTLSCPQPWSQAWAGGWAGSGHPSWSQPPLGKRDQKPSVLWLSFPGVLPWQCVLQVGLSLGVTGVTPLVGCTWPQQKHRAKGPSMAGSYSRLPSCPPSAVSPASHPGPQPHQPASCFSGLAPGSGCTGGTPPGHALPETAWDFLGEEVGREERGGCGGGRGSTALPWGAELCPEPPQLVQPRPSLGPSSLRTHWPPHPCSTSCLQCVWPPGRRL